MEFWIPQAVPACHIQAISVMDPFAYRLVKRLLRKLELRLPVRLDPGMYWESDDA